MFIGLIQQIGFLQINRMLVFIGDQGRRVIATTYPSLNSKPRSTQLDNSGLMVCTRSIPGTDRESSPTSAYRAHKVKERQAISITPVVCEAADGADAVRKVREHRPHVVLLDITMPVMNGFDAAPPHQA